jgi:7-alpha-hydroxysteroid dehydrogenase
MLEQFLLTDQVAIVTGAGRGIGAAIATTFAEAGADVVIAARTASQLDEVADGVRAHGRRVLAIPGDVNDLDFLATLVAQTVDEFGRLDILVNNAGGSPTKTALETDVVEVESSFHFNVSVPLELSRLVRPGNDQPRSIPQCARLRMQERGEGKPGGGTVQAGDRGTACLVCQCRGDRNVPLGH